MSYPALPFALVYFLASISEQRASLIQNVRHISVISTQDRQANSQRVEIADPSQFSAVIASIADLGKAPLIDTISIFYSDTSNPSVDMGILLEHGREPIGIEWTHSPRFLVRLIESSDVMTVLRENVGVKEAQELLARKASGISG